MAYSSDCWLNDVIQRTRDLGETCTSTSAECSASGLFPLPTSRIFYYNIEHIYRHRKAVLICHTSISVRTDTTSAQLAKMDTAGRMNPFAAERAAYPNHY